MPLNEAALAAELNARHGVTTSTRLATIGVGRRQIDCLKRHGRLHLAAQGVLVSTTWPDTLEHRMALACAATGGAVRFPTAGLVWKLRKTPHGDAVHVAIPEGRRIDPLPGVVMRRTCALDDCDIMHRNDGIAVTSPARTAFDAAWPLSNDNLESLIEDGIRKGYFTIPSLWELARRLREHGRPGSARFGEVLSGRPAWRKPVDSNYELVLERALRKRGFPPIARQCEVRLDSGKVIHPDLGIPAHGFYIEVDHITWHSGRSESTNDCRRDLAMHALGYHVERVTDLAIDRYLTETVDVLWTIWQRHLRSEVHKSGAPRSAERD